MSVVSRDRGMACSGTGAIGLGLVLAIVLAFFALGFPSPSSAARPSGASCGDDGPADAPRIAPIIENYGDPIETHTYFCGPIPIYSGQNRIDFQGIRGIDRPSVDGWITRMKPNLMAVKPGVTTVNSMDDLYVPKSSEVMFHHGVWLNTGANDLTSGGPERVYATGEEKTELRLPPGYGYRYQASKPWLLNHMIHNLVPTEYAMYITWEIDFIPDTSPLADEVTRVRTVWMDVQNGCFYPVFDVLKGEGGSDGKVSYPDEVSNPFRYCGGASYGQTNRWRVPYDGYIVHSVGHVHSGGLWTDLNLIRENAADYEGSTCESQGSTLEATGRRLRIANERVARARQKARSKRAAKARRAAQPAVVKALKDRNRALAARTRAETAFRQCDSALPRLSTDPQTGRDRVRLFRSNAKYFDRIPGPKESGPVSWDMGMYNSSPDFRAQLRTGDVLETTTTYETAVGSWYESMGIQFSYFAAGEAGEDPFTKRVDLLKELNHGPLPENTNHGGKPVEGAPDPTTMPNGTSPTGELLIGGYTFGGGDFFSVPGQAGRPLVVRQGESLRFRLTEPEIDDEIWHSLTACKAPCNRSTGIAYPLPDGTYRATDGSVKTFDSGQLGPETRNGFGQRTSGTVGRSTWDTPTDLPVGTFTFYCRIHPLMRGAIRVVPDS